GVRHPGRTPNRPPASTKPDWRPRSASVPSHPRSCASCAVPSRPHVSCVTNRWTGQTRPPGPDLQWKYPPEGVVVAEGQARARMRELQDQAIDLAAKNERLVTALTTAR